MKKTDSIQLSFKDVMILILIAAAAVSFVIACVERNPKEFFEPVLILFVVILNAILGVLLIFVPLFVMEASKAIGLIKHRQ